MTQEKLLNICDAECARLFKIPEYEYTEKQRIAFYAGFYKGLRYMIEKPQEATE